MITNRHVTVQEMKDALAAAVEARGDDYVYEAPEDDNGMGGSCLYWHEDEEQPGCIVGWVLNHLGATDEFLRNHEGNTSVGMLKLLREEHGWTFEDYENLDDWLNEIQRRQDDHMTWGAATAVPYGDPGKKVDTDD